MEAVVTSVVNGAPRLLDQVRGAALSRFGRPEPGQRYVEWTRRFILFHGKRHPRELGAFEIENFLNHVAQTEKDPLRCLEEARESLTFLYQLLHRGDAGGSAGGRGRIAAD